MTDVTLLNGRKCQTLIPLDDLLVIYKAVAEKAAVVIIQAFWGNQEGWLDLRRVDPDATFLQRASEIHAPKGYRIIDLEEEHTQRPC